MKMKNWEQFKEELKQIDEQVKNDIEEIEALANIISAIIQKRYELGYSQRELASICGLPQSSIARIEANLVKPNVETLLKIMKPLGLTLCPVAI